MKSGPRAAVVVVVLVAMAESVASTTNTTLLEDECTSWIEMIPCTGHHCTTPPLHVVTQHHVHRYVEPKCESSTVFDRSSVVLPGCRHRGRLIHGSDYRECLLHNFYPRVQA